MFIELNSNSDCGSYWSSPKHYFNEFKKNPQIKLSDLRDQQNLNFLIFYGDINQKELKEIKSFKKERPDIKLISWSLSLNHFDYTMESMLISNIMKSRILNKNYLQKFDIQGHRDFGMEFNYDWVPCASCLHPFFQKYKKILSNKKIGAFYNSKIFNIRGLDKEDYISNDGYDLESKLKFISNYEFIITNSYYGTYWAQLLNRKVICLPVKYSLLNFRYVPFYLKNKHFRVTKSDDAIKLNKDIFDMCDNTPGLLDESIEVNNEFFKKVINNT